MNLHYPYRYSPLGLTAETGDASHVRDLIEQVLFTVPGERVMLPDFGSGVNQLVFAPNSPELAATTQMLVQAALQQWLSEWIAVQEVKVEADEATLAITVQYSILSSGESQVETFRQSSGGAL